MKFHGFSQEALDFLKNIENSNTKEWFEAHRLEYERLILEPSRSFVTEMGEHLQPLVPTINAVPKVNGSLFRIYRDIRFSKNKLPLKSKIGIIFWQGGGKRMQSSSFYLHFDHESIFFAVGIRGFDDNNLKKYREYIKEQKHRERLYDILKELEKKGCSLAQPKYKRVPFGFEKDISHLELTRFASMYAYRQMKHPEAFFSYELCDFSYKIFEQMHSLQQWVYEMTLSYSSAS